MKFRMEIVFLCFVVALLLSNKSIQSEIIDLRNLTASIFFVDSVTPESLHEKFENAKQDGPPLKVLIVPGHDQQAWGTEFKGLRELDLNLAVGEELYNLFDKEEYIDTHISQTKSGYTPEFQKYFTENRDEILDFVAEQKKLMRHYVSTGEISTVINVEHNYAPTETVFKLYGINKWANDNEVDIVVHVHFNDFAGRKWNQRGEYSGFSVYIPEKQYSNAKGSKPLAQAVSARLDRLYSQSNLPNEDVGIVEDQELIAIGANNTLDGAGLLIEYGYIYESQFIHPETRTIIMNDLALQTYLGIKDFFNAPTSTAGNYETRLLPYRWQANLKEGEVLRRDVLSLQAALALDGVYPPQGYSKNDCPISGYFGNCTKLAVQNFQSKNGIQPAYGFVGEKTRSLLNKLYE